VRFTSHKPTWYFSRALYFETYPAMSTCVFNLVHDMVMFDKAKKSHSDVRYNFL